MSLAHKFTWGQFLKKNPEFKKKKLKRTSSEGEKAFKAAFKEFAKSFLKEREAKLKKEKERTTKAKSELVTKLKAVDGKKWHLKARTLNQKIGRLDSYLSRLETIQKKTTQLAKSV
ncbi:MAG: hypothetical protein A2W61_07365 [Deltaproteobacteria bacterium RIFCSPLOWO2_01_44_7]|nr:MAG: hypothetical protein A2712_08020 [Deltaproteobacteria bacterium RIFCSPHIGHO2_01_FULL_43_49]OGQ14716.1 MAG: hypothetical protein A3D22_08980 [Deltaproteobacteria bacterium RIFCSPHIGHO2_02_FULL_44_53]OGQ28102.1 MAG: hypothetical protein A3D98_07690 [Deltaproteobacteria bacterium RIFCSPHIGHO2_12_FULL_44_21]OGQ31314.1 MAG: hypothetical protein A2979_07740 [Deltaproteobacteria bacterium RIFCSPLOWO2_01_FULL_45_74]OGQ40807.1 MAG: hypothetical protein A2W61_07365 [Deltaproteobacteria bacterium 